MPNQHMQWNEMANVGNPTKSPSLNKLIGEIRRKETGRRGAPSKKRRALFKSEFEQAMEHFAAMDKKGRRIICWGILPFSTTHGGTRG